MPAIVYTDPPAGKCPVQAEGHIDGHPFYFRSRGAHWALYIAAPGGDPVGAPAWTYREEYSGRHAHRDVEINDGHKLAAGWADEDECLEFIGRTAMQWATERNAERKPEPPPNDAEVSRAIISTTVEFTD